MAIPETDRARSLLIEANRASIEDARRQNGQFGNQEHAELPDRLADADFVALAEERANRAASDAGIVDAPAPRHPHPNGGGWVADTATVDDDVFVGPNAQVLDGAQVYDGSRIECNAIVRDYAVVQGGSVVSDDAVVKGFSKVYGGSVVTDRAVLLGEARVEDESFVRDDAVVSGGTITGNSSANDRSRVHGYVGGGSFAGGDCFIGRYAQVKNGSVVTGQARLTTSAQVEDEAIIRGTAKIVDGARIDGPIEISGGDIGDHIWVRVRAENWDDVLNAAKG